MSASFSASTSFTPSPVIADDVPSRLQRLDHRALLLRGHPAEHRVRLEHLGELLAVLGERLRVERRVGAREADAPRDRGDGRGVVAGDHLDLRRPAGRSTRACRRRLADLVVRITKATGTSRSGRRSRSDRGLGAAEQDHAPSRLGVRARRRERGGRRPASPAARRARRAPTSPGRRTSAPLHLRADENGTVAAASHPSGASGKPSRIASEGGVRVRVRRRRARRARRGATPSSPSSSTSSTTRRPSVSVPVLSRHRTSTRASPSTAGSSCTSTRRLRRAGRRRPRTRRSSAARGPRAPSRRRRRPHRGARRARSRSSGAG